MRISRTLPALAALLFATACKLGSPDVLAPDAASASSTATEERGPGQIGSGNSIETGMVEADGSGNDVTTSTETTTEERGGAGLMGSGN